MAGEFLFVKAGEMAEIDYDAWDDEYDAIVNGERDNMWGMDGVPDIPVATETVFGDKWHESNGRKYILLGERVRVEIPFSEVAMYMSVAGRHMEIELTDSAYPMAQLWDGDRKFSAPITTGEAGVYQDQYGYYVYEVK